MRRTVSACPRVAPCKSNKTIQPVAILLSFRLPTRAFAITIVLNDANFEQGREVPTQLAPVRQEPCSGEPQVV